MVDIKHPSYLSRKPTSINKSSENLKEKEYLKPCLDRENTLLLLLSHTKAYLERKLMSF